MRNHGMIVVFGEVLANRLLALAAMLALVSFLPVPATAQAIQAPDFSQIYALERETLRLLEKPVSSDDYAKISELTDLRERLAEQRDRAWEMMEDGSVELRLLEARLAALGPAPEGDDVLDSLEKAELRSVLQERLAQEELPIVQWRDVESSSRTLVAEVDQRIREITLMRRLVRGPSPLSPDLWVSALAENANRVRTGWKNLTNEQSGAQVFWNVLLAVLILAAVVGGPYACHCVWVALRPRLEEKVSRSGSMVKKIGFALLEDAASTIVATVSIGIALTLLAVLLAPLLNASTFENLAISFVFAGLALVLVVWLAQSAFQSPIDELRLVSLEKERAQTGSRLVRRIGIVLFLIVVVSALETDAGILGPSTYLFASLLIMAGSVLLWRLSSLISSGGRIDSLPMSEAGTAVRQSSQRPTDFARVIGAILKLFVIIAVLAVLVGYVVLARDRLLSILLSLGTLTIALYLQRVTRLLMHALANGRFHAYRKPLLFVPLATGTMLLVATGVIIAVLWGYSVREVFDAMVELRNGVSFGDIQISIGDIFSFAVVFAFGFAATRWLQRYLKASILAEFVEDYGARSAIISGIGYAGIILASAMALAATGLDLSQLAFVAGALSVGLGFGLQSVVENFISGIILLIERPVKEGDWIEVGEYSGIVRKISVRSTRLETFDRHHIIIPNSQLITGNVKNLSFGSPTSRVIVEVGVGYSSDLAKVKQVLLQAAEESPKVIPYPEPVVVLSEFADSSINLRLQCFVADVTEGPTIKSDLNFDIVRRFAEAGIEIPFPQRTVHIEPAAQAKT